MWKTKNRAIHIVACWVVGVPCLLRVSPILVCATWHSPILVNMFSVVKILDRGEGVNKTTVLRIENGNFMLLTFVNRTCCLESRFEGSSINELINSVTGFMEGH